MDMLPLRVRNIFNSLFQPSVSGDAQQAPVNDNIAELLKPQNEATDKLNSFMQTQPARSDYRPSTMTNIMSRLGGLTAVGAAGESDGQMIGMKTNGPEMMNMIQAGLNRPYNQAIDDWNLKLKPLEDMALNERAQNTNNRVAASKLIDDQNKDLDRANREKIAGERNQLEKDKLAERYYYAAIQEAKAKNSNLKPMTDRDGYVYILDPADPSNPQYIRDADGDKIKSDKLPEPERIKLKQNNDLALVSARGSQQRQNTELVNSGRLENTDKVNQGKVDVKETEAGGTKGVTGGGRSTKVKMIPVTSPDGKTGSVPENKLADAIKAGYKVR